MEFSRGTVDCSRGAGFPRGHFFAAALLRFLGSEARGADWFPVSGDLKRFYNLFLWSEPRFCAKQGVLPAVFEAMAKPILSSVSTDR